MVRGGQERKARHGSPLPEIPDKLYFRIGEVSKMLNLPAYVLRFWETEFPHLKPNKGGTGQRLYRRRDVDALLEVRHLLYDEGYTIPGARQYLKDRARTVQRAEEPGKEPAPAKPADAGTRLNEVRRQLLEIATLLDRPVATGATRTSATSRGPHLLPRKRVTSDAPPPLFAPFPDRGE